MALTPCATASLMQVVCCWTSPLLSQTLTLKPYFSAFFWYIFQEKAWDGLSIWATNISVGLSPDAAEPAGDAAPPEAGAEAGPPEVHAATTRARAARATAPRPRCLVVDT